MPDLVEIEPGDDPIAAANKINHTLIANTRALRTVRRRDKIKTVFLGGLVVLAGVQAFVRYDQRVEGCNRDNTLRTGLLHVADTIERSDTTPSDESRAFIAELRSDFALRDCSDIPWL